MKFKKMIKKVFQFRKNETLNDYVYRKKLNFEKNFLKQKFSCNDLKEVFKQIGINDGDNIMVHACYRAFYNFEGTPEDIIDMLIELIGTNGNLFMPCYGANIEEFNVDTDKSMAGVLSECFRKYSDVLRSKGSHFSCAGYRK